MKPHRFVRKPRVGVPGGFVVDGAKVYEVDARFNLIQRPDLHPAKPKPWPNKYFVKEKA